MKARGLPPINSNLSTSMGSEQNRLQVFRTLWSQAKGVFRKDLIQQLWATLNLAGIANPPNLKQTRLFLIGPEYTAIDEEFLQRIINDHKNSKNLMDDSALKALIHHLIELHNDSSSPAVKSPIMQELARDDNLARFVSFIKGQSPSYEPYQETETKLPAKPKKTSRKKIIDLSKPVELHPWGHSTRGVPLPEQVAEAHNTLEIKRSALRLGTKTFSNASEYAAELKDVLTNHRKVASTQEYLFELFGLNQINEEPQLLLGSSKLIQSMLENLENKGFKLKDFSREFKVQEWQPGNIRAGLRTIIFLALNSQDLDIAKFSKNFVKVFLQLGLNDNAN